MTKWNTIAAKDLSSGPGDGLWFAGAEFNRFLQSAGSSSVFGFQWVSVGDVCG